MSFDNTKYDVELNGVAHRIRGYVKNEAPAFVPRIGGAQQSATEFNTLLSRSLEGFDGGMLQRYWKDDTSVFASEGLYPIYDDGTLYPVDTFTDNGGIVGKSIVTAYLVTKDYVWYAYQTYNTPANVLKRRDTSGTVVTITLPANLSSSSRTIKSIVIYNNGLWIGTSDSSTGGYTTSLTATTITELGSGTSTEWLSNLVVYKGSLYGTDGSTGAASNAVLRKHTGGTSSRAFTVVGDTGIRNFDETASLFVYNNRIMLFRKDGMWAYDGVQMVQIEDATKNPSSRNYMHPNTLKGFLYYFMPDGFYRYNGSLIEKLYDSSEIGFPVAATVGKNRLWFGYSNSRYSGVSRYDKSMGYDFSGDDTSNDGRVAVFNGKALYTYGRFSTMVKDPGGIDMNGQEDLHNIWWFNDQLYVNLYYTKAGSSYVLSTAETALTGSKAWRLVSSIFDADFPMVFKNIENIEIVLDGDPPSGQNITIEYRTGTFSDDGGWTTLGTVQTTTELKRYVWKTLPSGLAGKEFQFRLSGTTLTGSGIKKLIVRYTLQPEFKWQWQFDVLAYGDDPTSPLILADGTEGSQAVRTLRGNIYAARSSTVPVKFVDIDQLDLNGAHNNSTTSIVLNSTALLKGSDGFIQIDDEIMYWSAKTSTTLTVLRGQLGTAAASHSDNAKVFIVYRVFVKQIPREGVTLTDNGRQALEDKDWASQLAVVLTEV